MKRKKNRGSELRDDVRKVVYERKINVVDYLADEPLTKIFSLKLKRNPSSANLPLETYLKVFIHSNFDSCSDARSVTSSARDSSMSSFCVDSDTTFVTADSHSDSMAISPALLLDQTPAADFSSPKCATRVREMSSPPFMTPPPGQSRPHRQSHSRKSSTGKRMTSPLMYFNPPEEPDDALNTPELESPLYDPSISVSVADAHSVVAKKLEAPEQESKPEPVEEESSFEIVSESIDLPTVTLSSVELLNELLVKNVHKMSHSYRYHDHGISIQACVLFRIFAHWQAFRGERRWILSQFVSALRQTVQRHGKIPQESLFWMQSTALLHSLSRNFETEDRDMQEGLDWFAKRVHQICTTCFDQVGEIFIEKFSHIDWQHLFREDNDTESHTIDSIMVMLRIATNLAEESQCHSYFKAQFIQTLVGHVVERLFNSCMIRPSTCSIRTGFKLKIASATISEWSNETFASEEAGKILIPLRFLNALSLALLLVPTAENVDILREQIDLNPAQLLHLASNFECEPNEIISSDLIDQLRGLNEDDSQALSIDLQGVAKLELSTISYDIDLNHINVPMRLSNYNAFSFLKEL